MLVGLVAVGRVCCCWWGWLTAAVVQVSEALEVAAGLRAAGCELEANNVMAMLQGHPSPTPTNLHQQQLQPPRLTPTSPHQQRIREEMQAQQQQTYSNKIEQLQMQTAQLSQQKITGACWVVVVGVVVVCWAAVRLLLRQTEFGCCCY